MIRHEKYATPRSLEQLEADVPAIDEKDSPDETTRDGGLADEEPV